MQLFLAYRPLAFIAIDIPGLLRRTTKGNQHVIVLSGRYSMLTRAVTVGSTTATHVANMSSYPWTIAYGIPTKLLTDNADPFTNKREATTCTMLAIKNLKITAYHRRTNGKVERNNRMVVTRLWHCIVINQRD